MKPEIDVPRGCCVLKVNMIANGKFYQAGVPMPLSELERIPANLGREQYIIRYDPNEAQEPEQITPVFRLNESYRVSGEGRLLQRQAAQLEAIASEQEAIEEQWQNENDNLDPVIAEQIQDEHDSLVQRQIAEAQADAKQREMTDEAAKQFIAEQDQMLIDDSVSPAIREEPIPAEPKPRRMRVRFLCRNGTWLRAKRVKNLRIGEPVFVRNSQNKAPRCREWVSAYDFILREARGARR